MDRKPDEIRDEIDALKQDVTQKIEELRDRAVDSVGAARDAVHSVGEKLNRLDDTTAARWIRERPILAVGGALATGFLLGRIGTSSSSSAAVESEAPQSPAPANPPMWHGELDVLKEVFMRTAIQSVSLWAADRLRGAATPTPEARPAKPPLDN